MFIRGLADDFEIVVRPTEEIGLAVLSLRGCRQRNARAGKFQLHAERLGGVAESRILAKPHLAAREYSLVVLLLSEREQLKVERLTPDAVEAPVLVGEDLFEEASGSAVFAARRHASGLPDARDGTDEPLPIVVGDGGEHRLRGLDSRLVLVVGV